MAVNAAAIQAGKAFVEMFIDDETVDATLAAVTAKLKGFGAVIDTAGAGAFRLMGGAASGAGAAISSSIGFATRSVTTATAAVGGLAASISLLGAKSTPFGKLMSGFLNSAQTTEATGRWTRFLGSITGSSMLTEAGRRIERAGMAASIVKGFQGGGLTGGFSAALGAGIRSAKSMVISSVASTVTSPFRMAFGAIRSTAASVLPAVGAQSAQAAGGMLQATGAAGNLSRAVSGAGFNLMATTAKLGGFAAVLTGAGVAAARRFVTAAQEIQKTAAETGRSVQDLITERFGSMSLISPADIAAAAELGGLMTTLKQSVSAAWAQIGAAAMPVLKGIVERGIAFANTVTRLVANNRQLVSQVVVWAARLAGAAAAIASIGGALAVAGPMLSVMLSPLGLVSAGLAGLVYMFPQIRQAAADALNWLIPNFGELLTTVRETIGGITDALMGGDIQAAANVLWAGVELAFRSGASKLIEIWRNVSADLQTAWVLTFQFFGDAWQTVLAGFRSAWSATQDWFARGFARVIARMTGQDAAEVLATLDEMQAEAKEGRDNDFAEAMRQREEDTRRKLEDIGRVRDEQLEADKDALGRARDAFRDARDKARELRPKGIDEAQTAARSAGALASGFGSFSTAAVGRIGIAGLSTLEDLTKQVAANTKDTADAIKASQGLQFA